MENIKKRLKIGLFLDNFYPNIDGVVMVVDNLAKALSKYNDVTVVVPYTSSYDEDFNRPYKVIRINSYPIPFTEYRVSGIKSKHSSDYKKLLKENFDVIHIHSPFTIGALGVKLAKKMNIPVIATMHTRFDFEIRKILDNDLVVKEIIKGIIKVYNKCDKCIAVNHAMVKVFKDFGYKYNPIVIYNGTDLLPLKNKEKNINNVNKLYNLNKDDTLLLFVGRITEIKNIFFILDVIKKLKEEKYPFKMMYVGSGPDEKKLKSKIREYKLKNDVILTGKISDRDLLSSIYARANLFLFPSIFDASSIVQIEASVNETPGLFIEGSVTADTITNDFNGFTSRLDINEYKNRIKEIIGNKELLNKVSINARKTLAKNWKDISLETYNLYLEEIKKKK